jgi:signal transduction histidine kinase/phage shock protein PspC (stress-responsive transcriptional regulator)
MASSAGASPASSAGASPARVRRYRYPERGMLGGVCAGLAEYLRVRVALVRFVTALIVVAGGIGVAVYVLLWALTPVAPGSEGARRPQGAWREALLIVLAVAGVLIALRHTGFWVGDRFVWPVVLGLSGMTLVWRPTIALPGQAAGERRRSLREYLRGSGGRIDAPRLAIGLVLVGFASASLLHASGVLRNLGDAIGAVAIVAVALGLLVAPWFVRLGRNLAAERAARIREQERAEVAAHLHDSVLQTLALIQKRSGDPREVAALARRQERELRRWLFERPGGAGEESVRMALQRAAAEVEELHGVPIEAVVVGDQKLDTRLEALVPAAREAMTNAAKFAGVDRVDLYAEVGPERVEVFVRDRGVGFEPDSIPEDRRGVRDSIVGRVERHGGRVCIRSAAGEGTEVELAMECARA